MKLKEFMTHLDELLEEFPEAGEFEVIYSKDDKGNGFNTVNYTPVIGVYKDYEFYPEYMDADAVCIN